MALALLGLLLGAVALPGGRARMHTLSLFNTVVSEPGPGLPEYFAAGYIDDQLLFHYDSEIQRVQPRAEWVARSVDPQFWDGQTMHARRWQAWFRASLGTLRELYNETHGVHTIQTIYGCVLRADNTTQGFYQDLYDGRTFLTFDKETMTWVAADIGGQISKRRWDADVAGSHRWKHYLEEECVYWIRKHLENGKEVLLRQVRPTARVNARPSHGGLTTLSCQVRGFYPRDITVAWLKNGEVRQQETYYGGILPNGDGTYQTRLTMEVDPKIGARYSCLVEHESLWEPLSVSWEPSSGRIPIVIGVVCAACALMGVIVGVVLWEKSRSGKRGAGYAVAPGTKAPPSLAGDAQRC
uniref:Ig-like domain-containing protein n=1 Tax=Pelusios castaneus TaxID=367368 RepID=A0A8C8SPN8_9SAUR